ncbi:MAG TPA: hypothetical protein VF609_07815 [Flavisolibacter sp.]|jgi:hypothetical protein
MMILLARTILPLLFLSCLQSNAQDFTGALQSYAQKNIREKIYVHFDRDNYVAGETVWFKAYLYRNGTPSLLSSNFYVRMTNEQGKIIDAKKYPVEGASVKGDIGLPDSLPQGSYTLTAYTAVTLNCDEDFIYRKKIFVHNPVSKPAVHAPTPALFLQFFPESGNLIDGVTTVVAFKALDQSGKPANVSGTIKSNDGFSVPFQTFHEGVGKVSFRPAAGKTYTATVNGSPATYSLPTVEKAGINLHVQDEKGGKAFTLTRRQTDKNNFQNVFLVAQINNQVVYERDIDFEDYPSIKGHLLTSELPSGILHFTVFNKGGAPLVERLAFVDNKQYLANANVVSVKQSLQKREENIFEITTIDDIQKSLSVSVTDGNSGHFFNRESILSAFLLTGDLKGYIHNPAWYFLNQNDTTRIALDNLLLTHGWSRFNWKKVLTGEVAPQQAFDDIHLLKISGTVKDARGKEVKGGKLNLYIESKDSTTQTYDITVTQNGHFLLDSLLFYGPTRIFYNYFDDKDQQPAILHTDSVKDLLHTPLQDKMVSIAFTHLPATEVARRYEFTKEGEEKVKELESITLQAKATNKKPVEQVNEKFSSGAFRAMGKINIDNMNQPTPNKSINVVDFSLNQIRQLLIEGGQIVNIKNMSLGTGQKWPVAIFLDETPADISALRGFRMDEIALIKFYEPGFVGAGTSGPGGALAIYTKKSRPDDVRPAKMNSITHNGFSITKEFYQPDYSIPAAKNISTDYRSTLYWNPNVYMDSENKKIKVRFFNNDYSKKLRLVVEGFAADGKLIHIEKMIE